MTAIVTGLVTNNQLNCVADSTTFGGDPAFGILKSLQIALQFRGTNRRETFTENSTVSLGETGQSLIIIRALYGDPKLFGDAAMTSLLDSNYQPARFRRIQLPKEVVALCGGRHMLGAALTANGEVWSWGEALGQHTRQIQPLQVFSRLLGRVGVQVQWGDPRPVILKEPSRLGNFGLGENSTGR